MQTISKLNKALAKHQLTFIRIDRIHTHYMYRLLFKVKDLDISANVTAVYKDNQLFVDSPAPFVVHIELTKEEEDELASFVPPDLSDFGETLIDNEEITVIVGEALSTILTPSHRYVFEGKLKLA